MLLLVSSASDYAALLDKGKPFKKEWYAKLLAECFSPKKEFGSRVTEGRKECASVDAPIACRIKSTMEGTIMFLWFVKNFKLLLLQTLVSVFLLSISLPVYAAQVTLKWGTISNAEGYRIYCRKQGASYQYSSADWSGKTNTCAIGNLADDTTYYFVARAYAGTTQSANSNEVSYHTPAPATDGGSSSGGDQYQPPSSGTDTGSGGTYKLWYEAEEGDIFSPMAIADDSKASDAGYIEAPVGSTSMAKVPGSDSGRAEYAFEVATAGDYVVWGRVNAATDGRDSFYVAMDQGDYLTWHVLQTSADSWAWDVVSARSASDVRNANSPFVYHLNAGVHKLTVATREPGTKLDRILVTDVLGYTPSDTGEPAGVAEMSKIDWRLVSVDSQELVGENGAAVNAFDGDPNTIWHTEWKNSSPVHPHELVIDLGQACQLDGFTMLPRQGGSSNGRIIDYKFYVGNDPKAWPNPVATGSFANNATEKLVTFNATVGRYIRLVALSAADDKPWTSVAELGVRGVKMTSNVAPDGTIVQPSGDLTIQAGGSVVFKGSATDPDGDTPLTCLWQFGAGSGIADYAADNTPGAVVFATPGTYTVTYTVTDAKGKSDPAPACRVIKVVAATGGDPTDTGDPTGITEINKADWQLVSVDSEERVGEDGAAVNAFDGDPKTIWHTEWRDSSPVHPHELVIDLGTTCKLNGFSMLPRQDGSSNGWIIDYKFYVGNDPNQLTSPVASGSFANNANEKTVTFNPTVGRYIRLVALSAANGKPWTSVAEIGVKGTVETAPSDTTTDSAAKLSKNGWQLVSVDSEELVGEDGAAENAFDNNPATIWHTEWRNSSPVHPHEIVIDLGTAYSLEGLSVLPRQDGSVNGRIIQYALYVGNNTSQWTAASSGSFTNTAGEQQVTFGAVTGRYVRLVALSAANNAPWTSLAEIGLTGTKVN